MTRVLLPMKNSPILMAMNFNVSSFLGTFRFSQYMSSGLDANVTNQFWGLRMLDKDDSGGTYLHCKADL